MLCMTCDELYYDGQCPLCVAEMDKLEKLVGAQLKLVDIHGLEDNSLPDRETLLGTLHLRQQGRLRTGLDANVEAWQYTRYGWLWRPLRWPLIHQVASLCYNAWARWRYRRLYGRNPPRV